MEGIADIGDEGTLLGDEVEFGVNVAVDTLASLTTNSDDGGIGRLTSLLMAMGERLISGYFC